MDEHWEREKERREAEAEAFAGRHGEGEFGCWNSQLVEAASWRLACELCRRFPKRYHLIEYHPGGGQSDCLGLMSEKGTININRCGSMHISGPGGNSPAGRVDIRAALMKTGDYRKLLDDVCALARVVPPKSMPSTTPKLLVYRFVAAFLSHAVFGVCRWECRQGYLDTSGSGGGTRTECFKAVPWAATLLTTQRDHPDVDNSDEFWFLTRDGKAEVALHVSGWAAAGRKGAGKDLMALYRKHGRRVWPVVMEVAGALLP